MAKITSSERARALAEARWRRYREGGGGRPDPHAAAGHALWRVLSEVPPAVALAAAEEGLERAKAERLADLALLLVAEALWPGGNALLPHPDTWRGSVAWDALFAPDGASLVAGAIAAESAREAAEAAPPS